MHPILLIMWTAFQSFIHNLDNNNRASHISRKKTQNFAEKLADFAGKKSKFAQKSADFAGFSREKSQNSLKNRPILRDFSGKKSNFERFSGQILRKIGRFHGKFLGKTSPRNNQ